MTQAALRVVGKEDNADRKRALDAALIFAPVGALAPAALRAVRKGGTVICAGIHMSDIPAFPYAILWGERSLRSVANLTRADGEDFFALLERLPVRTQVQTFALADGLTWRSSDGRVYTVAAADLAEWIGNRAEAGRLPPKGFPKNNRFVG